MSQSASVSASKAVSRYLRKCPAPCVGLLLGQSWQTHTIIVHAARTPHSSLAPASGDGEGDGYEAPCRLKDVREECVAEHADQVVRMLPGGVLVLGIFVVSDEDVFGDQSLSTKLRSIVKRASAADDSPRGGDRYVLHFSPRTETECVKCVDASAARSAFRPVKFAYASSPIAWRRLECYYEFDDLYPVIAKNSGVSVKEQFRNILNAARESVESATVFLDGRPRDGDEPLDAGRTGGGGKSAGKSEREDVSKPIGVSVFVDSNFESPSRVDYLECEGTTHFSGVISSKVFVSPKCTVADAVEAVKRDIVRSLSSRFTMHCDALIHDTLLPEEKICFNEPPRRVMIKLSEDVHLCDYLFPGESPAEALTSVKEMLDADLTEEDVICDAETPADTSEFDALDKETASEETSVVPERNAKIFYAAALVISILVLILSFVIQRFIS